MTRFDGLAAEIEEAIGTSRTEQLLSQRGGTELKLPARADGSLLAELIGAEAAQQMIDAFGHGRLRLPMGPARGRDARRARAIGMLRDGKATLAVALACGVGERTVERWRAQIAKGLEGPEQHARKERSQQLELPFD